MRAEDAFWAGAVAALALALCLLLFQRLRAACFDPDFARVQGLSAARTDLALLGLIVTVTVAGLQAVGLILIVALLVLPAATARLLTFRLPRLLLLSALIGAFCGAAGAAASALDPDLPTGAAVVLAGAGCFTLALFLSPDRGLLAEAWRTARRWLPPRSISSAPPGKRRKPPAQAPARRATAGRRSRHSPRRGAGANRAPGGWRAGCRCGTWWRCRNARCT
jgi:manganese/zinc/iron transport system permease protein